MNKFSFYITTYFIFSNKDYNSYCNIQCTKRILSNITLLNNLLLNSYFENPTVELHVLYVLNMHANFHTNHI